MITLSIKEGSVKSPIIIIHKGSASDSLQRTDILDIISNRPDAIISGDPTNPILLYFENFEYKALLNASRSLLSNDSSRMLLSARSLKETLHSGDLVIRTSQNKLLVNDRGKFIRIKRTQP